jgi:cholesterol transport system auxiliary component
MYAHSGSLPRTASQALSLSICFLAGLALITGCSFKKGFPARQTFLVEARRAADAPVPTSANAILRVRPATVVAPFDDKAFVYRDGASAYETDFYHGFLVPPRLLFPEAIRQWLADTGLFRAVVDSSSRIVPTHSLETTLTLLYGDFRSRTAPKAVLAIQFHLLRDTPAGPQIQFHRAYQESVPLEGSGAESLVRAWSSALERILRSFEADVAALDLEPALP